MKGTLIVLLCLAVCYESMGFCMQGFSNGTRNGCVGPDGLMIPYGETNVTSVCQRCQCRRPALPSMPAALSCCGYGKFAGPASPPAGCVTKIGPDGCERLFVMAFDNSIPCPGVY